MSRKWWRSVWTNDRLEQKYGETIADVLDYAASGREELDRLQSADERRDTLRAEYRKTLAHAKELAQELSARRREAAVQLEERIVSELRELDMAKVQLSVQVETGSKLTTHGLDTVAFLISVNPGKHSSRFPRWRPAVSCPV